MQNDDFKELLWEKTNELYRPMPWRENTKPYYVLVSELMLQQTQVARVVPKFEAFIERFPNEAALGAASLGDVLTMWQGLGYNRRAKYLHEAAKMIVSDFDGHFPEMEAELLRLPGVGKNTAGAVLAYSFNKPSIFIETNIRTVYIHHFFADNFDVEDKKIIQKLTETIDTDHPREFYWALMDYGSWLKANGVRNVSQSRHYKKQSTLTGSLREMRGRIVKVLSAGEPMGELILKQAVDADDRFDAAINGLLSDGLISRSNGLFHLTK